MTLRALVRESEPYSRYGNISAEGIQRLLGAPNIDRLQTVIRETVQNTWDARAKGKIPEFRVILRKLNQSQQSVLQSKIFSDLPQEPLDEHSIKKCISGAGVIVLELCDFGTTGLGGPTRPDEVQAEDEPRDFVDFIRNIGSPRDTAHGGGTYGYGKSSLYALSHCHTVIIDTVTKYRGKTVRRLIASRVSHRFDVAKGHEKGKYTGRHWWGIRGGGEVLGPITGEPAEDLAAAMGLPIRKDHDYGTSVMILAPEFNDMTPGVVVDRIRETLLWNFWPKFLSHNNEPAAMKFRLELNGADVRIPRPEDTPPLDIFAAAMKRLKKDETGVQQIRSQSPKKHLGKLVVEKAPRGERKTIFNSQYSLAPCPSCHVALMRPAELVVKYLEGQPLSNEGYEWAGVFVCDEDDDVEHAFSSAEPPAHDDWMPNYLPSGKHKTYVNVALREIKRLMKEYSAPPSLVNPGNDDRAALGQVGDALGRMLFGVAGQGPGRGPSRPGGTRTRKEIRLTQPKFLRLEEDKGKACALFEIGITGPVGKHVTITGHPAIVVDGGLSDEALPDGTYPEVLEWRTDEGRRLGAGESVEVACGAQKTVIALVSMPGYVAVAFNARIENN